MAASAESFRLFLDASVLIAASASPQGGSAAVLELCGIRNFSALVTRLVLQEAERNIQTKLDDETLLRFYNLISDLEPELIPIPDSENIKTAAEVVARKDAHVLAAARDGAATHLVTLDRKHFLEDDQRNGILPIIACTPGDLLRML